MDGAALAQPFEDFFIWRHETVCQAIPELAPLLQAWPQHLRSELPSWSWLGRCSRSAARWCVASIRAAICLLFVGHAPFNRRFSGARAVVLEPYLARSLRVTRRAAIPYPKASRWKR